MHQDRELLDVTDLFRLGVRVHRNTLRRWIVDGIFPKPINITQRHRYWDAAEVRSWLESRKAERSDVLFNDFSRRWTKDQDGNPVLVGLTADETSLFLILRDRTHQGETEREEGKQYLALHNKHEAERHHHLNAEIKIRS